MKSRLPCFHLHSYEGSSFEGFGPVPMMQPAIFLDCIEHVGTKLVATVCDCNFGKLDTC